MASSTLKPCDAGEERNPDTNRCRKTDGSVAGLSTVKDVQSPISGSPKWWLAGASFVAALGYAVYEWRSDLLKQLLRFKQLWARG